MPLRNPETAHWRDSARPAKFFFMSAYGILPLVVFLVHIRLYTLIIALSVSIFFAILEKFGFTLPIFMRWLRVFLGGKHKLSRPWWK